MERYSEYKDSGVKWLGEIPSHWEVVPIKHSYKFTVGWTPPTGRNDLFEGINLWANISDLGDKVIRTTTNHISDSAVRQSGRSISPKGSLLYSFKLSVGTVSFCGADMYTNEAIATFLKGKNSLEFLYYAAPIFIIKNANTNIYGAPILNQDLIKNALVLLPPLSEQDAIVRYLDSATSEIDKAIAMQQKMIDLLNERKQIIIQNAVTKGLDENVEMKESGVEWIGSIPKHWKVRKIKTVANFNPLPQRKFQQDEIVGYLPMERLGLGSMNPSEISYGKMPVGLNYIEDGDVVIAKVTPCFENGKIAIAKNLKNGCAFGTSEIFVYRPIKIDSVFLLYSLQNEQLKNKCASTMMGTGGLKRVNASFAKNVYITFPPTEKEQNEIGLFLENKISTFNKTIENIQRQITLLQERKQIIINEVVTGKVRVS